ncbi:MAG: hypothetical protein C4527_25115 [Candidatus Omnitrophota bacterium]|nr:MAG: hypothetical protein C4527_25115 [Candidatus Omnitrophota bacterium]
MDTHTTVLTRSPYQILKITRWAGDNEIKERYFQLVKQYNPEYFPDEFIEIRTAYDLLKEPSSRATADIENFAASPPYYHSDFPDFPQQTLSLFKLNQEIKTLCGDHEPEQLKGEPREQVLHSMRGIALYQAFHGNPDEARTFWRHILAMNPDDSESKKNLACTFWNEGFEAALQERYDESEKLFQQVLEHGLKNGAIYINLSLSCEKQGKKAEADECWKTVLDSYRQELKSNPDNKYLQALIVAIHKYTGGKYLEGNQSAADGLGSSAGSAKELGYACIQKGNWKQAVEALEQALRENEGDVDVLCQLGWAYLNTNQQNRAFHMWNLALKKAPGRSQVSDHLIRGYTIFGKRLKDQRIFNQALVQFKNALKYDPDNVDLRLHLADTFFQMRNFSAAMQEYQRVLDVEPRNKVARQGIRESKRLGGMR